MLISEPIDNYSSSMRKRYILLLSETNIVKKSMSIFDNYLLKLPSNLRRFSQIVPSIRVSMFFSCCDIIGLSKVFATRNKPLPHLRTVSNEKSVGITLLSLKIHYIGLSLRGIASCCSHIFFGIFSIKKNHLSMRSFPSNLLFMRKG